MPGVGNAGHDCFGLTLFDREDFVVANVCDNTGIPAAGDERRGLFLQQTGDLACKVSVATGAIGKDVKNHEVVLGCNSSRLAPQPHIIDSLHLFYHTTA